MGKRDAEPELTCGNEVKPLLVQVRHGAEVAGGGRLSLLPMTLCTTDTVLQRQQDCRKSWPFPTLQSFFSQKSHWTLRQFPLSVFAVSEVPSYMCAYASDPLETALIQILISLWKTLSIAVIQADDQTWRLVVQPWPWRTNCEWQVAVRVCWYMSCTGR